MANVCHRIGNATRTMCMTLRRSGTLPSSECGAITPVTASSNSETSVALGQDLFAIDRDNTQPRAGDALAENA